MTQAEAPAKLQSIWRRPQVVRILVIAFLAEMGYAVLNISTMPVYLKFDRQLGSVIGFVLAAFLLSEAVFKGPMGHLADRVGRRRLMMLGPALTVGTSLCTLIVPRIGGFGEVAPIVLLRMLDGVGAAMLWPAAFALMSDSVEDAQRQEAMSLLNLCYLLGVALALPAGGLVNELVKSRSGGLWLAAVFFALVSVAIFFLIHSDTAHRKTEAAEMEGFKLRDLIHSAKQIPEYLVLSVITYCGVGFLIAPIKIFAEEQFEMSETAFGFLVVLPGALLMAILSVPMSKLGERIGRARAVHLGLGLCAAGLAIISLGAFVPALRTPFAMLIGGAPVGVGFLLVIPAWMASVSDLDPAKRGANLGAIMTAQGLGAIIGAPIGAWMYEGLQTYGVDFGRYSPFIGCAVCVSFGWLLSLKILHQPK